jgi:hypothetical protein
MRDRALTFAFALEPSGRVAHLGFTA